MILRSLEHLFTANATSLSASFDRDLLSGPERSPPGAICLQAEYAPEGAAPTGTIAFDAKIEHSTDGKTWEDVSGGAITTIAVGTRASAGVVIDLRAVVVYRYLRINATAAITGTPNWQSGSRFKGAILAVG